MATMRWIITLWTAYFVDLDNRQSRDSRLLMTAENAKLATLNTQLTYLGDERGMLPCRVMY